MKHIKFTLMTIFALLLLTASTTLCAAVPRSEYPRPQFERADWVNLNGEWTYAFDFSGSGLERDFKSSHGFGGRIIVPFAPESNLSGVGYTDFINHIWYQRTIEIPTAWSGRSVMLNFGAVYYESEVYIDGQFAGRHFGGSSSFTHDITRFVKPGGVHSLVVLASSDLRSGRQTAGKQSLQFASHACEYTRTTGIWQTVWMEAVATEGLARVQLTTDIDQSQIVVRPEFYRESGHTLKVVVKEGNKVIESKTVRASNSSTVVLPIKNPKLWSPESPFLYDITYHVLDSRGKVIDEVISYAGMRKIHTNGNKIYLNNKPYYQRLVLDQGFYPDGIWTAPSDEALRRDIELGLEAGFNGARLHQKVFEERYYYWADRLGYITWGEMASWGLNSADVEVARNFLAEWGECVVRDRNHPSLVTWTPLNEEFWPDRVQYPRFVADIYDLTKLLDPTRPINTVSGGIMIKTDIWAVHRYDQDPAKLKEKLFNNAKLYHRNAKEIKEQAGNNGYNDILEVANYTFPQYDGTVPYLIDEFGGIKWVGDEALQTVDSQTESWGYGDGPRSIDEFYTRLEGQVAAVLSLSEQVWGYCYTQLTDVEQEQNGIYHYDRTTKFDMERIRAIFNSEP